MSMHSVLSIRWIQVVRIKIWTVYLMCKVSSLCGRLDGLKPDVYIIVKKIIITLAQN
jgi:hypothetical protein